MANKYGSYMHFTSPLKFTCRSVDGGQTLECRTVHGCKKMLLDGGRGGGGG